MQYICFHHLSLTYICSDKHIIISIMAQIHILLYLFLYSKLPFFQPIINCLHSVFEQYYTAKYKHNLPPNIQSEQNWNTNRIFSTALNVYSYLWVNWQVKINMKIINILPTSSSATCSKFHIVFIYLHFRSLSVTHTYICIFCHNTENATTWNFRWSRSYSKRGTEYLLVLFTMLFIYLHISTQ